MKQVKSIHPTQSGTYKAFMNTKYLGTFKTEQEAKDAKYDELFDRAKNGLLLQIQDSDARKCYRFQYRDDNGNQKGHEFGYLRSGRPAAYLKAVTKRNELLLSVYNIDYNEF